MASTMHYVIFLSGLSRYSQLPEYLPSPPTRRTIPATNGTTSSKWRPRSPIKNIPDLTLAEKPMRTVVAVKNLSGIT